MKILRFGAIAALGTFMALAILGVGLGVMYLLDPYIGNWVLAVVPMMMYSVWGLLSVIYEIIFEKDAW